MSGMRRRQFIALLGGAVVSWPLAARAQQTMPVIGYIGTGSRESDAFRLPSFHQGLSEAGYVAGRNVAIEYRWAEGQNDRLPALAADLVRRQVAVIAVPASTPGVLAAKGATTTIPIVFYIGLDPVELGLVASLAHPGGNITGVTGWNVMVGPKRLELLHEVIPSATSIALLVNPASPDLAKADSRDQQTAARSLGLQLHVLDASNERDFDTVFATLVQLRAGGLVIGTDSLFNTQKEQLAALTVRHGVPTIHQYREFVMAGGLMAYGSPTADLSRQVGVYTARILKGEKPADLPVQQATKVELFMNLKTAKTLGLTVPLPLLARADEVIE
ncbi:MAG TPA: ABC transporter substrate-binding protein [Xanthobacteraceae bacterium]|jgi:putative ABC transport system substrate-binding protein